MNNVNAARTSHVDITYEHPGDVPAMLPRAASRRIMRCPRYVPVMSSADIRSNLAGTYESIHAFI